MRHNLGTGDFRRFARGEATARGGEERTVALIGAQRSEALGFQDRVRAVRLSSESVERHPRYAAFETADWQRVQRILDRGEWIEQPARHRLLWLDEDGKPWAAVVKLTENGEVYLQSYRRASRRNVGKWEERCGSTTRRLIAAGFVRPIPFTEVRLRPPTTRI